jgi:hypothetical protein
MVPKIRDLEATKQVTKLKVILMPLGRSEFNQIWCMCVLNLELGGLDKL